MISTLLLIGFSLAVVMGAGIAALLIQLRPQWSRRRRLFSAAAVLPSITALFTLFAILWIWSRDEDGGGNMRDLAVRAIGTIGAGFTLLALFAGALGALLADRRRRR